jgi:polyisoprenoid-binding protein YceI
MRRLLIAAVVVVIVAAAGVYALFFTGDSEDPFELESGSNPTIAPESGSIEGRWQLASGSEVGYRVREKLARLPAQSDAVGRTTAVTGSVELVREGANLVARNANFDADVSQLRSDESRRDNAIRTRGLETARFPKATFVAAGPIAVPAEAENGGTVNVSATGDLTIHGVTKRVTIPMEARLNGSRIELGGAHTFPFSDFGIEPPNVANIVTVEDEATLEYKLFLEK